MAIIDEKDLDPVVEQKAGGQIITPDMLDPISPGPSNQPMDATAASLNMFAPESLPTPVKQFGAGLVNQLPTAGMVIGGMAGAAAGGPLGPFSAPVGAGIGGGIGAAAQGLINQGLGLTPPQLPSENWQNIAKEGAMGAGAEMGGPILAKGIQAVISPFAKGVEGRMAADASINAAQKLVDQGTPISPDVIADTKTSKFFNWLAEKMWPANAILANRRQGLQEVANGLKDEFVTSRGLYDTSKGGVNAAWEDWVQKAGGAAAPYEMPKTAEALTQAMQKPFAQAAVKQADGSVVNMPVGTFWKKHAATFADTVNNTGAATVQDIRDLLNVLNPTAAKGAERTARMKIADAIVEDLSASGNQEMVQSLANARDMARLQRIAGPLQNIFNNKMVLIQPTKPGEIPAFNPAGFVNLWNQKRGWFLDNKNYTAEDVRVIDAFADKMKALVPDLARGAKYTPSTSLAGVTQFNLENPLAVIGSAVKYPGLAVPVGMDMMLANSLMNPNGIMRKFLTTGFEPPILSTKVGLMKGLEAAND